MKTNKFHNSVEEYLAHAKIGDRIALGLSPFANIPHIETKWDTYLVTSIKPFRFRQWSCRTTLSIGRRIIPVFVLSKEFYKKLPKPI